METAVYGKSKQPQGIAPAVGLINPKYPHNVGAALRAASCFQMRQVWFTGNRVSLTQDGKRRIPREERMKGYQDVELRQFDYLFDQFDEDVVPVAIERRPNAESLVEFEHPEKALYVFGPEDGGLGRVHLQLCHRFVYIPMKHCANLASAVYMVGYDRMAKQARAGITPPDAFEEIRWDEPPVDLVC